MSNSGAIRIHHPPQHQPQPQPPLLSSSMRSPVHQQHPHASARMYSHRRHGVDSMPPPPPPPPAAPIYAHAYPSQHYGAAANGPAPQHSHMSQSPATAAMASEKAVSVVSLTTSAAAAAAAAANTASGAESEIHAGAGLHTSSVGSAAPQPLHPPAQSYESASSYAAKMQSQSKAAEMHVPAIYARRDTDIAARFSDIPAGFARAMPQPPMSLTPATPAQPFAHSRDQPLSSPGHKVSERSFNDPPMTVPVSSAPVFKHVVQHESRLYAVRSPDQPWSPPSVSSKPLPFSNGASRPKLPPLSEIFGKDYQSVRSPGGLR
ncbi:hypothetical protein J3B02_006166 [Coemansia erecta]|nr:hypothetical protein J3B02_006166 [Coemansia erecta]